MDLVVTGIITVMEENDGSSKGHVSKKFNSQMEE
jgi:hypothetical protein